jgi:hypothetical protein
MLGLAKRTNAKLLLASTSEVYGDPLVHPQPESYFGNVNPIGERSCYDEGVLILHSAYASCCEVLKCVVHLIQGHAIHAEGVMRAAQVPDLQYCI